MNELIPNTEGGLAQVAGNMRPVWVTGSGLRRTDMHMQVRAVRVLDQPSVKDGGTLVGGDLRLRMDAKMECVESGRHLAKPTTQNNEKTA